MSAGSSVADVPSNQPMGGHLPAVGAKEMTIARSPLGAGDGLLKSSAAYRMGGFVRLPSGG